MLPIATVTLAFFTGLTSGGFSCVAVQGGLLSSILAKTPQKGVSLAVFLISKLLAYTLLGFTLGSLGQSLSISFTLQGWLQIFAGIYMIASGANLLNLHPIFRYTVLTPPRFLFKFAKSTTRAESIFTPALIGAFTILLPCGVTQSVMLLSLASGSGVNGAFILGAFTLATIPQFLAVGAAASIFLTRSIFKIGVSLVIFYLGIVSINTGQILRGSPHTIQNYLYVLRNQQTVENEAPLENGVQRVTAMVSTNGYSMSSKVLHVGVPVQLRLVSVGTQGCARAFSIPTLGITKILPETGDAELTFTPNTKGLLTYSCNMGMHTGSFEVI